VIATLVFLDGAFALGTGLSVGHNPGYVLALGRILSLPLVSNITVARTVGFLRTLETKRVTALAIHVTHSVFLILYTIVATLEGTPSHVFIVICKGLAKPFHICLQIVSFQVF
jgi:hypothetical protein